MGEPSPLAGLQPKQKRKTYGSSTDTQAGTLKNVVKEGRSVHCEAGRCQRMVPQLFLRYSLDSLRRSFAVKTFIRSEQKIQFLYFEILKTSPKSTD
jgi:hypothetical protein